MQFMVDCVVRFDRRMEQGIPVRRLEISKYRGSAFAPGEFPLSFGPHGMEVASPGPTDIPQEASTERVSTGFAGLDQMLGGGLFRGSSTLITGAPGTSKTTLAGLFAESACRRGERTLFVSFDEGGERIRRNLKSVGIHLDAHMKSGLLQMYSGRTDAVNPEEHLLRIAALIAEHRPRCMVIDPLSAISRTGALSSARAIGNRLIYKLRDHHITAVITALVDGDDPQAEATELQISTIADNWIQLSYLVRGGERNRALTIVKSRGTRHSNQVRELILSDTGPRAGGCVFLGRRSADGHAALGKGSRGKIPRAASGNRIRAQAPRAAVCRGGYHRAHRRPATRSREAPRRPRPLHARRCRAARFVRRTADRGAQTARREWSRHRDPVPGVATASSAASTRGNGNGQERARRGQ